MNRAVISESVPGRSRKIRRRNDESDGFCGGMCPIDIDNLRPSGQLRERKRETVPILPNEIERRDSADFETETRDDRVDRYCC